MKPEFVMAEGLYKSLEINERTAAPSKYHRSDDILYLI